MKKLLSLSLSLVIITALILTSIPEVFAAYKPGKVTLSRCTVSPTYTTLNWNKVSGASGYEIQYKPKSAGKYKSIKTSAVKYTFYGLSEGDYDMRIRAYSGSSYSSFKTFTYKNYYPRAKFSVWYNAASGCTQLRCTDVKDIKIGSKTYSVTGYQAMKKVSGKYQLLKTIKDTTYSVTLISRPHIKQDYAMRYYVRTKLDGVTYDFFSGYNDMSVTPTPETVRGVYTYVSGNNVTVSWSKPSGGADGYRVYMRSSSSSGNWGNWFCVKTINSGNTLSYTHKGNSGCSYAFRIAAFSNNPTQSEKNQKNINEAVFSDSVVCSIGASKAKAFKQTSKTYKFSGYDGLILVGDSRTEYMSKQTGITANYPNTVFIGLAGSGYDYLKNDAMPQLKRYLNNGKRYIVVFNHGVNDLGDLSKYKSLYSTVINNSAYCNHRFIFMSVNPVFDGCRVDRSGSGTGTTNTKIRDFNKTMKSFFGAVSYIDCYSYMIKTGYDSYDGIHYAPQTNKMIMQYILSSVEKKI